MNVLNPNQCAVITGAALGIGRAAAKRMAQLGMRVCLVDLPGSDLDEAVAEVRAAHANADGHVLGVEADVSDQAAVQALASRVAREFGAPHFLMNNAVTRVGRGIDGDIDQWRRAMDVNFFGVVHGVRAFLPMMQRDGGSRTIVNVGSKQGITNPPGHPIYNATKAALKSYTEVLEHELRGAASAPNAARVSAHLLIPGWTTTGRNEHQPGAWLPAQVVDYMITGLDCGTFYIVCPDDEVSNEMDNARIAWGAGDIIENRPPLSRWHPDYKDEFEQQ